ncbi:MAG TPA: GNAT family N-acetyltransferase [Chitinophagaceae bacterium]|nr:GNAT family N-acetyltransferase [Chitinophagaceae bacterium]
MAPIIITERLTLREFIPGDAAFILQLLNTESWIRYIGDRDVHTIADAEAYLQNGPISSYRHHGYGLWLVSLNNLNIPVGTCGIIKRDTLDHPDIGFAFLPEHTGKGLAQECAAATVQFAFEHLHLPELWAITLPDNRNSIRLLERVGMSLQEEIPWPQTNEILLKYTISKAG